MNRNINVKEGNGQRSTGTIVFEYVVQCLQQGTWQIPSQRFTYFDSKSRSVKTIKSSPITVVIEPSGMAAVTAHSSHARAKDSDGQLQEQELSPIITDGNWQAQSHAIIPWSLFFIIALIPLLWAFWKVVQIYLMRCAPYFMQRNAFGYARKQIQKAKSAGASNQLLAIFMQAIAARLNCSPSSLSQEIIEQKLANAGLRPEKINAFASFLTTLHERSFYKEQASDNELLFEQAYGWLDELERVL